MAKQGYIKLHRQLQECWVWIDDKEPEPFSKGQAWVDLLMLANHKDKKTCVDNKLITIQRGQRLTSIRKLAERWKWSRKKVSNFLDLLESDDMIHQERATKYTLITIVNYSLYQCYDGDERATEEPHESHRRATREPQRNTNKNDKNDKNDKKRERARPIPSIKEVTEYCRERGNSIDPEHFVDYYDSIGWDNVRDWKAKIRSWENNSIEDKPKDNLLDQIDLLARGKKE